MAGKKFPLDKFPELLKNPPHDVDIMLYDKKKKGSNPGDNTVNNSNDGRMTLTKLAEQINARFDNLEKDFNKKIDQISTRLDYIVDANNLKDNK